MNPFSNVHGLGGNEIELALLPGNYGKRQHGVKSPSGGQTGEEQRSTPKKEGCKH